jgi:membrane protein
MSLTVLLFATLYRALPNCEVSARATLLGAVVAASLWELTKHLFAWYVIRFPSYDRLYGPLSSLVILLIWIYYSVSILFLGAEMAADYDKKRPQT